MSIKISSRLKMILIYFCGGLIFIVMCFIPYFSQSYYTFLFTIALTYGLFAMSYDLLLGYMGLISVSHSVLFGIAAYGTLISMERLHLNLWAAALIGVSLSIVIAWIIGFFSTRARGSGFIIMTIIFTLAFHTITWTWTDFTGGENGLILAGRSATIIPGFLMLSFKVGSASLYYFSLIILTISYLIFRRLISSPLGMIFQAIKGNEKRAKAIGYNVERYKIIANIIAGIFAGIAGILFMLTNGFISADIVGVFPSAEVIIWTLIGGAGSLIGPILGAVLMTFLTDFLKILTQNYLIIIGAIFFFIVMFFPDGIVGLIRQKVMVT